MESYERILEELLNDNVRYLPRTFFNELLNELRVSVEFQREVRKEVIMEILVILKLNPYAKEKVEELLKMYS
ncbi:MAG TPA: hypothetical protein EYP32_05770 [Aquificaceae bacterium]|nr:hypothetical protein [Aquificaceae bacterium]HIQ48961.1 hypothetical protein [Aquifex aeolicus]